MGKGPEWSEADTVQLCRSWLETSEDPIVGTGQKKASFLSRLYEHWLENKTDESGEDRSATAVGGRWKKLQPEVTKFCGVYARVKSRERSGWNDEMYLDAALKIYAERHKQPFEFLAAWNELKDKPKWTTKITSDSSARAKRKAGSDGDVSRPGGRKAAKAAQQVKRNSNDAGEGAHLRFAAATERKVVVMEQQLHLAIFMQDPESDESKEFFSMQRKSILEKMKKKNTTATHQHPHLDREQLASGAGTEPQESAAPVVNNENDAADRNNNSNTHDFTASL